MALWSSSQGRVMPSSTSLSWLTTSLKSTRPYCSLWIGRVIKLREKLQLTNMLIVHFDNYHKGVLVPSILPINMTVIHTCFKVNLSNE